MEEWKALILEALAAGITYEEIEAFLIKGGKDNV